MSKYLFHYILDLLLMKTLIRVVFKPEVWGPWGLPKWAGGTWNDKITFSFLKNFVVVFYLFRKMFWFLINAPLTPACTHCMSQCSVDTQKTQKNAIQRLKKTSAVQSYSIWIWALSLYRVHIVLKCSKTFTTLCKLRLFFTFSMLRKYNAVLNRRHFSYPNFSGIVNLLLIWWMISTPHLLFCKNMSNSIQNSCT